tara:strand:+ start:14058 stop:14183 length:126 start_codon:yes stop_codon:yes gene_type:complete
MIIKPPVGDYSYLPEDMRKEFIEVRKQIDKKFYEQIAADKE